MQLSTIVNNPQSKLLLSKIHAAGREQDKRNQEDYTKEMHYLWFTSGIRNSNLMAIFKKAQASEQDRERNHYKSRENFCDIIIKIEQ